MADGHVQIAAEHLNDIRTLEDVLEFFADDLDWPITSADLEDASFEYEPADLGIAPERVPHLRSIHQLRPLTTGQPWGIFFLEFEGPRLPITPLRQLLRALVTRKRAGGAGERRTWDLSDLLFVITTTDQMGVELHLVAFETSAAGQLQIFSLPWRPNQSPPQHLHRLANELLPRLAWPGNPDDAMAWRSDWHAAFSLRPGAAIKNAKALAMQMATVAHDVRDRITAIMAHATEDEPLFLLYGEIREQLIADLSIPQFADTCAQTLVYGLLSSRVTDPIGFGASPVLAVVPLANPFLDAFFERIHDRLHEPGSGSDALEQLVADLRATNVEAIVDQFGASARGADPVIHFYEEFLKEYDPELRAEAGAFYTPQPVVNYMVRMVDEVLRSRLGLVEGLADASTRHDVCETLGFPPPTEQTGSSPFLSIIDPATGTGTYLVEWMRQARASFVEAGGNRADWPKRLADLVLPSLNAFELMPGPYSIAHLKTAIEAHAEGVTGKSPRILLTDGLDHPNSAAGQVLLDPFEDPVAFEGQAANRVKESSRFSVVIGNPPYRRQPRDEGGSWVVHGDLGFGAALFDDVLDRANDEVIFSEVPSLYNLYAYFWRWALWAAFERETDGPAVTSFITAKSWLRGGAFVGLREIALRECDEIWVTDLGGEALGAHPEENVFEIQTPVAIVTLVRWQPRAPERDAVVRYRRVRGTRAAKLADLSEPIPSLEGADWQVLDTTAAAGFQPTSGDAAWERMPALRDIFPWQQPGAMLNRTWTVAPTDDLLGARWRAFVENPDPTVRSMLFPDPKTGRKVTTRVGALPRLVDEPVDAPVPDTAPYGWRPFDTQRTFRDARLAALERPLLWQSLGPRQLFLVMLVIIPIGPGPALVPYTAVPDKAAFRGSYGGKDVLPLYLDAAAKNPNLPHGFAQALRKAVGLQAPPSPENIAAYAFALLSTPAYQQRFANGLEDRILRVPVTTSAALWTEGVALGERLLWLSTFGRRFGAGEPLPSSPTIKWDPKPNTIPETPRAVRYSPADTALDIGDGVLMGVTPEVWNFSISGWPVLRRWVEHRTRSGRGRSSSALDDIGPSTWDASWTDELPVLVNVLTELIALRAHQDALLDRVMAAPLVAADTLPQPLENERQGPGAPGRATHHDTEPLF